MHTLRLTLLATLMSAACSPEAAPAASKAVSPPTPAPAPASGPPAVAPAASPASPPAPAPAVPAAAPAGGSESRLVGVAAIAAWDALPADERERVKTVPTLFLHQSVGQDLEDGAKALGFPFEYYGPGQATIAAGLNGGIFVDVGGISNGDPAAKLAVWREHVGKHPSLKVAVMKFGYADVLPGTLEAAKRGYLEAVAEIRKRGAAVLHVTPPLVFDVAENPAKQAMRSWMLTQFPGDVILDFADLESTDPASGARCEEGGVWRICPSIRSREGCASEGQGIDGPGQGHLCAAEAKRLAKALLFAVRLAAKG
jgi:hypothetical protein